MTDFAAIVLEMAKTQGKISEIEQRIEPDVIELKTAKHHYEKLDAEARELAMAWFHETGDKQPHQAVSVSTRQRRVFDYDQLSAMLYADIARIKPDRFLECMQFLLRFCPDFLEPDMELIEKNFAKGDCSLPFQEENELYTRVSKKLGEYLIVNGTSPEGS